MNFCKKQKFSSHGYDSGKELSYNWGILIPHDFVSQGARANWREDKITEYQYGLSLSRYIKLKAEAKTVRGHKMAVERLMDSYVNCVLEPHLNAYNGKADGFELLTLGDSYSLDMCEIIASKFIRTFPDRRLRHGNGIKIVKKGDRGYKNLKDTMDCGIDIAILSEAFFIDNPKEWIDPKTMAEFWTDCLCVTDNY